MATLSSAGYSFAITSSKTRIACTLANIENYENHQFVVARFIEASLQAQKRSEISEISA
jgi:hypothetical protein